MSETKHIYCELRNACFFILFVALVLAFAIPGNASEEEMQSSKLFRDATVSYEQGEYEAALAGYQKIVGRGIENGYLYYNIANCYYKLGEIGRAILNYRMAERLIPWHADLRANLELARSKTRDKVERTVGKEFLHTVFFWYHMLSLRNILYALVVLNLLLWSIAPVALYSRREGFRWLAGVFLVLTLVAGASTVVKYFDSGGFGVVIGTSAEVYSAPGVDPVVIFTLNEGTEMTVHEEQRGFYKIELPDGKKGWARQDVIGAGF